MAPLAGAFTGDLSASDVSDVATVISQDVVRSACLGSMPRASDYFRCVMNTHVAVQEAVLRQASRAIERAAAVTIDPHQLLGAGTSVASAKSC